VSSLGEKFHWIKDICEVPIRTDLCAAGLQGVLCIRFYRDFSKLILFHEG